MSQCGRKLKHTSGGAITEAWADMYNLRARSVQVKDGHDLCVQQHTSQVDAHASCLFAPAADVSWNLWISHLEFEGFMDAGPLGLRQWSCGLCDFIPL